MVKHCRARRVPLGHLTQTAPDRLGAALNRATGSVLHTDGVTEARDAHGAEFGLDRLVDLAERHHHDGLPAPGTLRRISHAVLAHQRGHHQDDATLLLLEWATQQPDRPANHALTTGACTRHW
jgi:serine phosphatase RsbU (regulator of sigma subunit)